ncbi:MAG: hypothetical protein SP4CHLAM5_07660 [Chlamydiia bacterium]|nr:hypothetical protein [Chlamydiia bacterium]MCH9618631.1 hypothetical protein [Chlamydiia bacterium]MCH9623822.1 hypothetical protein [Chlamydiia bacterium]
MKISKFKIEKGMRSDRDEKAVLIHFDGKFFAEVFDKQGVVTIRFYGHPTEKWWEFFYDQVIDVLRKAKEVFLEMM